MARFDFWSTSSFPFPSFDFEPFTSLPSSSGCSFAAPDAFDARFSAWSLARAFCINASTFSGCVGGTISSRPAKRSSISSSTCLGASLWRGAGLSSTSRNSGSGGSVRAGCRPPSSKSREKGAEEGAAGSSQMASIIDDERDWCPLSNVLLPPCELGVAQTRVCRPRECREWCRRGRGSALERQPLPICAGGESQPPTEALKHTSSHSDLYRSPSPFLFTALRRARFRFFHLAAWLQLSFQQTSARDRYFFTLGVPLIFTFILFFAQTTLSFHRHSFNKTRLRKLDSAALKTRLFQSRLLISTKPFYYAIKIGRSEGAIKKGDKIRELTKAGDTPGRWVYTGYWEEAGITALEHLAVYSFLRNCSINPCEQQRP
jgi:hypothetical protein